MTETNIFKFRRWIADFKQRPNLEREINYIHFEEAETLTKSIVIDLTTNEYIARFTMWEDDSCVSEVIEIASEKEIWCKRFEFSDFQDFQKEYSKLEAFLTQDVL